MTTRRITFHADEASLAYLEKRQQETGASVSEIIRRALRKMDEQPAPVEYRASVVEHAQRAVASAKVLLSVQKPEGE